MHEGIPIHNFLVPKAFTHEDGKLTGMLFEKVEARIRRQGPPRAGADRRAGRAHSNATTCWSRSARRTPSPGSSATSASSSTSRGMPGSTRPPCSRPTRSVFFGGDAAFGPKNIIWAVAHGHEAAISIDQLCRGEDVASARRRWSPSLSQKMGIHEWSYDNDVSLDHRYRVPHARQACALNDIKLEVELGFDRELAWQRGAALPELRRPDGVRRGSASSATPASTSARWTASPSRANGDEAGSAHAPDRAGARTSTQDLYVSGALKTGRVMAKDEDVCLHCGLCAERCPTGAWDMQKFYLETTQAGRRMPQPMRGRRTTSSSSSPTSTARARPAPTAVRQGDPAHGRAGRRAQHLPLQHPGPADLVRGAGLRGRLARPARRRRPDGRHEPADLGQGRRRDRARRLPVLRFHQAAAADRSSATTSPSSACR